VAVGEIIDCSRQSWQRLQITQAGNSNSIPNSAGEKMCFANLIHLSKVLNLDCSCEPLYHPPDVRLAGTDCILVLALKPI
jgi:hypothetical protein